MKLLWHFHYYRFALILSKESKSWSWCGFSPRRRQIHEYRFSLIVARIDRNPLRCSLHSIHVSSAWHAHSTGTFHVHIPRPHSTLHSSHVSSARHSPFQVSCVTCATTTSTFHIHSTFHHSTFHHSTTESFWALTTGRRGLEGAYKGV